MICNTIVVYTFHLPRSQRRRVVATTAILHIVDFLLSLMSFINKLKLTFEKPNLNYIFRIIHIDCRRSGGARVDVDNWHRLGCVWMLIRQFAITKPNVAYTPDHLHQAILCHLKYACETPSRLVL